MPDELRRRRQRMGLSQQQLSQELGVAVTTVARWERGEAGIPKHLRLAIERLEQLHKRR